MPERTEFDSEDLRIDTMPVPSYEEYETLARLPTLTIQHHPRMGRVGDRVRLDALKTPGGSVGVSRLGPEFAPPSEAARRRPLGSPFISRRPFELRAERGGAVVIDASGSGTQLTVNGATVTGTYTLSAEQIADGVVLVLSGQVVLSLDIQDVLSSGRLERMGLVGDSPAIQQVRDRIRRVAMSDAPVLLRGETGTGKELIARAIHEVGPRRYKPFVSVNMGAVPTTLAASELFGHVKGAFSGASTAHRGFFERANGGVLFLDEIGDTPPDAQSALLRVLETGEIQSVGADKLRHVDVRLVAATDANLEHAVEAASFRAPLYYRLAAQEITAPPLRERRDDVGRLLLHFLTQELQTRGALDRLQRPDRERRGWLSAGVVARLVQYHWPGNVRQLRNVAAYLASMSDSDSPLPSDDPGLLRLMPAVGGRDDSPDSRPTAPILQPVTTAERPSLADITDDDVEAAMEAEDWRLGRAAGRLHISRPAMNSLVDRHPSLRRPISYSAEELKAARADCGGDLDVLWRTLRVSKRGLRLRLKELGLLEA